MPSFTTVSLIEKNSASCRAEAHRFFHLMKEVSVLPFMQAMILNELYNSREKIITSKELGQRFGVTPSAISGIVKRMRRADLVITRVSDRDNRVMDILLTDAALALEQQVKLQLENAEQMIRRNLSEEESKCLFHLLEKIEQNIS